MNLEFTYSDRLAAQQAPGSYSSPFHSYKYVPPPSLAFMWVIGIRTWVFLLGQKLLYALSYHPIPQGMNS